MTIVNYFDMLLVAGVPQRIFEGSEDIAEIQITRQFLANVDRQAVLCHLVNKHNERVASLVLPSGTNKEDLEERENVERHLLVLGSTVASASCSLANLGHYMRSVVSSVPQPIDLYGGGDDASQ